MTTVQDRLLKLGGSLVVLGALGAYAYFGTYQGKKAEEETKQKDEKMASFTLADVKGVRMLNKGVTYEIVGDGEGDKKWRIVKPIMTIAEKTTVEGLITHFVDMKRKRAIDVKAGDLAHFGLEPPLETIAFKVGDKDTQYLIGKKNSFDDAIYVMREGDAKVSMVPGGLSYQADRDLFQLREKRVYLFQDSEIQKIAVEVGGKPAYTLDKKGDDWMLGEVKADRAQVSTILSNLHSLRAKSFPVETLDKAATYGLDKPAAVVTLNGKTRIAFGEPKDHFYAYIDGGPVFELDAAASTKFDLKPSDLRDKTVLSFNRDDVKKIKLAQTGKDFILLEKKGDVWEVAAPEQKPANDAKVSNLLYKLSALKAKSILADKLTPELKKKHGLDPIAKQITLYKADGAEAGMIVLGNESGDVVAVTASGADRLDGVEKAQLGDLSFESKDYVKEELAHAASGPTK